MDQKETKTAESKPNLLYAILTAIGLGLVGCVLYGVLYYVGYIAWIASYVAVIAAAWGYKHFNKKMDWRGYLTVAVVSIGGLLIAMFLALTLVVSKKFGSSFSVAFKDLFMFLDTNTKLRVAFVRDAILTAVFTLLGLLSYFFYERRLAKTNNENSEEIRSAETKTKEKQEISQPAEKEVSAKNENTKAEKTSTIENAVAPAEKKVTAVPAELKEKPTTKRTTAKKKPAEPTKPLVVKPVVSNKPKTTTKKTDKKGE